MKNDKIVIGRNSHVDFTDFVGIKRIPAKIDTGADSSAVWASQVEVDEDGFLSFVLFGKNSEFYTGETYKTRSFDVGKVRSSSGHIQIRYRVRLAIKIKGKKVRTWFNLSDRSKNRFPVLIGRRSLNGKFLVDVSRNAFPNEPHTVSEALTQELHKNPYEFNKKYYQNSEGGNR